MEEPEIVAYGRMFVKDYCEKEFQASLIRTFKEDKADFIALDDNMRGNKFRATCVAWAMDKGLLYNDRNEGNGQCKVSSFRLTEAGKKAILN